MKFTNAAEALVALSDLVMSTGELVEVRGAATRELRQQSITLTNPLDRNIVVAGRRNNIFAAIAESMWVLAGRDDIGFLAPYLPRAADFSDDGGATWRAAYGPRLRNWHGVDQLDAVRRLLLDDPTTRRAVVSIFDPAVDYVSSNDIPCTNWLSFSLRDGALDLSVAVRSNDLFWGFSGINTFEWSLLQEMMAFWIGARVGRVTYFIASLHIYERHFGRAEQIAAGPGVARAWSMLERAEFSTSSSDTGHALDTWFDIENDLRRGHQSASTDQQNDPLFRDYSRMLDAYWRSIRDGRDAAERALDKVQDASLRAAGRDYFAWKAGDAIPTSGRIEVGDLIPSIIKLHRSKDEMYRDSWKKRGEQMAVLANIARKIDRLAQFKPQASAGSESWFDTAVDLFVYAVKYKTFLLDAVGVAGPGEAAWSDGPLGFEALLREQPQSAHVAEFADAINAVEASFRQIEESIMAADSQAQRLELVQVLISDAASVLEAAYAVRPASAASEIAEW